MKKQKNNSGITLIALVITIIVLLILAGVSINAVVGSNGVLSKAQSAVTENQKAAVLERAQMILAEWQTDYLVSKTAYEGRTATNGDTTVSCINGKIMVVDTTNSKVYTSTTTFDGNDALTFDNGVALDTTSQMYKAMHPEEHMPATTGWTHVTGTWNSGYVIKDSNNNEFVWIPVMSEAEYVKKSGKYNWHMLSTDGSNNTDLFANGADDHTYVQGDQLGLSTIFSTTISSDAQNVSPEKAVVCNAGGFWVSRYEIGIASTERTSGVQSGWTTSTIQSKAGSEPVRDIKQTEALSLANTWKTGDNVQSGLITGTQWDVMCNFIGWNIANNTCTEWGNYYDNASQELSVGHSGLDGNYSLWYTTGDANKGTNHRQVFATGSFISANGRNTAQKNIFDVAGNVWEWTTEVPTRSADNRVLRGGSTYGNGYNDLAAYRHGDVSATSSNWDIGFRAVLYVK